MNTLKAIQYCFPLTKPTHIQPGKSSSRRRSTICFSNSDGDKQKQELLAQIAMLQAQKVRLTDFLDERSSNLTQFAEDARAEFDSIGENALKDLDDAGTRIMEKLESRMQAFEETAEMNRQEIESNERVLEEFQEQFVRDKNEGLFFKNLQQKTPQKKPEAEEEAQKLRKLAKESASSRTRRNFYLALMLLLILAVGDAVLASPELEWWKVGALLLILFGLLAQFIYEQSMSDSRVVYERHVIRSICCPSPWIRHPVVVYQRHIIRSIRHPSSRNSAFGSRLSKTRHPDIRHSSSRDSTSGSRLSKTHDPEHSSSVFQGHGIRFIICGPLMYNWLHMISLIYSFRK